MVDGFRCEIPDGLGVLNLIVWLALVGWNRRSFFFRRAWGINATSTVWLAIGPRVCDDDVQLIVYLDCYDDLFVFVFVKSETGDFLPLFLLYQLKGNQDMDQIPLAHLQ